MASNDHEVAPLLSSDRQRINHTQQDFITRNFTGTDSTAYRFRRFLQWFLTSKYGHYLVIVLVSLDVCGIFADFLISLHICEHSQDDTRMWQKIDDGLDTVSLVFSCLFMLELLCSIFAFGLRYTHLRPARCISDSCVDISHPNSISLMRPPSSRVSSLMCCCMARSRR